MVRIALLSIKEWLLLLYLILGFTISQAQEQSASGAASLSLAGADLCLKDGWTANNNPAALTFLEVWSFSAAFSNSFLIKELSQKAFTFNLPKKAYAFALSGQQYGFSDFRQNQIGLAYAQNFGPALSLGLQFNYHHIQLSAPYGNEWFYTLNLGLLSQISPQLELATVIINPNRANSPEADAAYSPQAINLGLSYQAEEYLALYLQTDKELDKQLNTRLGIQYSYKNILELRLGIAHQPQQLAFGFSYFTDSFQIDIASAYNLQNGFSPAISLSFYPGYNGN
jgi:hypothetical protein